MTPPVLSIVITARHDNYGGDFRERIATPLRFNYERLSERGVAYEVILVEWDPIPGRPLLCEMLAKELPEVADRVLKPIVVAPEYQIAMTQNPRAGFLEYPAKNVGVRRAAAPFVLVTNSDILLGREVVDVIATGGLRSGTVYRAAQCDIKLALDHTGIAWDALEHPANQIRRPTLTPPLFRGAAGAFLLADRETFQQLRGFNEVYRGARSGIDLNFLVKAHGAGVPIADVGGPVYHVNHVGSFRSSKAMYRDAPSESPWGDLAWHSRHVTYNNPDGWGLVGAPARQGPHGRVFLDFDWRAVPPLVDLKRVVLPGRHAEERAGGYAEQKTDG